MKKKKIKKNRRIPRPCGLDRGDTLKDALKRADRFAGPDFYSGMMCERKDYRRIVLLAYEYRKMRQALSVIEGLTLDDVIMSPEKKIEEIYKYAHVGLGDCQSKHLDWLDDLDKMEETLIENGITTDSCERDK